MSIRRIKSNDFQRVIYMKKPRNRACLQQALFSSSDIVIPTQLLSSLNRSNSNALWHILPHFSPFCEGLHYSTTDLPWQTNNIFIILDLSFHKPLNLDICGGLLGTFLQFCILPLSHANLCKSTQIYGQMM